MCWTLRKQVSVGSGEEICFLEKRLVKQRLICLVARRQFTGRGKRENQNRKQITGVVAKLQRLNTTGLRRERLGEPGRSSGI